MNENIDSSLSSLASEINELDAQDKTEHRGKQAAMGHKLLAVRELLRARNGEHISGKRGLDGKRAPNGWQEWLKKNLTTGHTHANNCVRFALDPEGMAQRTRAKTTRDARSPAAVIACARRAWPHLDDAGKGRIAAWIRERAQEEATHVVG